MVTRGPDKVGSLLAALRQFLGQNDMMAYLTMMAHRMVELHRVLKPTGSIYLHCDPTASHYLKLLMDAVFGSGCFRNLKLYGRRQSAHNDARRAMVPFTTSILFYRQDCQQFTMESNLSSRYETRICRPIITVTPTMTVEGLCPADLGAGAGLPAEERTFIRMERGNRPPPVWRVPLDV